MITQCPNCATSFRVSPVQLAVAEGAVRCGACLQVFPADRHMIPGNVDHHSEQQLERQTRSTEEKVVRTEEGTVQNEEKITYAQQQAALTGQQQERTEQRMAAAVQRPELKVQQGEVQSVAKVTAAAATAGEHLEGPLVLQEMNRSIGQCDNVDDAVDQESAGRTVPLIDGEDALVLAQLPADQPALLAADFDDQANAELLSEDEKRSVAYNLSLEPDEIEIHFRRRSTLKWCGWTLLNLLMILLLVGQFSWFHQDELFQQEELRGWYELLCDQLQCELVDFTDVTKIKTRKLVIRSHPDVDEALIVDAIIFNDSQFAQPFPLLYLSFTDIEDKLVASRRFKPVEYLAGELAGYQQMPAQTEVHLSLEIVDPGTSAVSYQLKVERI